MGVRERLADEATCSGSALSNLEETWASPAALRSVGELVARSPAKPAQKQSLHTRVDSASSSSTTSATNVFPDKPWPAAESSVCKRQRLQSGLTVDQVEPWQRFPYITQGYRRGGSASECFASLFSWHNETVNAWTTLLSIVMGLVLFADTVSNLRSSWLDFSPFLAAWVGQTLHGPLSFAYHTFMCMSPAVANRWRKLDLTFILVLNTCATYALSYFTFGFALSLVWTALVACAAAVGIRHVQTLQPKQQLDRRRIVGVIGLTACGYYIPITLRGVAALVLEGKVWPELGIALVVLGCHAGGALVYRAHWPQRHFPGVFDLAGFSHNLMHILCFTAYNCAYPYLSHLYSQRAEWAALWAGAAAAR